ncbi:MAG: SurA N-terminal domain-containing protein [Desulfarculus sp.]|nr:SurA N-terminal domain-containing protein [Desulfarculus sp.]
MASLKMMLPALGCLLTLVLAATPAPAQVNRVVAVVGDEVITSLDLDKVGALLESQVAAAAATRPGEQLPSKGQLRRMALERLIEDKIFEQEVKRANLSATTAEVEHYIERIKAANQLGEEEFAAQLSRRGLTPDEYRQELKREILKHKLVERSVKNRVVISDKEVEAHYRQQQGQAGGEPGKELRLRALFLNLPENPTPAAEEAVRKQAEELRKQVAGGQGFAELARRHSQGPGAEQGGELGPVPEGDLLPEMRQALSQLKPGQVSQVIKLPGSYAFLQLMGQPGAGGGSALRPEMREQLRVKLEQEALEKRFREWLTELRSKSYVRVMDVD